MGSELASFFSVTDSQSEIGSVVSWNCLARTKISSSCFCLRQDNNRTVEDGAT